MNEKRLDERNYWVRANIKYQPYFSAIPDILAGRVLILLRGITKYVCLVNCENLNLPWYPLVYLKMSEREACRQPAIQASKLGMSLKCLQSIACIRILCEDKCDWSIRIFHFCWEISGNPALWSRVNHSFCQSMGQDTKMDCIKVTVAWFWCGTQW